MRFLKSLAHLNPSPKIRFLVSVISGRLRPISAFCVSRRLRPPPFVSGRLRLSPFVSARFSSSPPVSRVRSSLPKSPNVHKGTILVFLLHFIRLETEKSHPRHGAKPSENATAQNRILRHSFRRESRGVVAAAGSWMRSANSGGQHGGATRGVQISQLAATRGSRQAVAGGYSYIRRLQFLDRFSFTGHLREFDLSLSWYVVMLFKALGILLASRGNEVFVSFYQVVIFQRLAT
ncbi:alpha/beta-Hydrolases superfamily protein [Striga asiatica]|uniref:Alpha/beta-Hydrolases superfamily protein n=1 Tax=Striga asiatica TaxID=4170 RepID=A0A5A7RG52_STRAF|nr:alpha/beta-Hydrolases superfamily protein [Striga asiatica]